MNRKQIPKLIGKDAEFAGYVRGREGDTCKAAVRLLLAEMPGLPSASHYWLGSYGYQDSPSDTERRWFPSGGCAYEDSAHVEIPTPEVLNIVDFVYQWRAVLLRLQRAAQAANEKLPSFERLCVHANNCDGFVSWASHLNVLMRRDAFDDLFAKPLHFLWLASWQASSQVFCGAGKVGSSDPRSRCRFQLSQRGGDYFPVLMSWNTMDRRGLLNERDEAHAGLDAARLHCIYYDSTLCDCSTYLQAGTYQLAVAMLESGYFDSKVLLEDPVDASRVISHSLGETPVRTLNGKSATAIELQYDFYESATRFVAEGLAEGVVPGAGKILSLWGETLDLLQARDYERLSRKLDWVAKLRLTARAVESRGIAWESPGALALDLAYSSLDPDDSLFLALEGAGLIDRLTDPARVAACLSAPPEHTRAYTRGRLLELAADSVVAVDWDYIKFRVIDDTRRTVAIRRFEMEDPLSFTRADTDTVFRHTNDLEDVLDGLEALRDSPQTAATNHRMETKDGTTTTYL